jgi:hypothetical protein
MEPECVAVDVERWMSTVTWMMQKKEDVLDTRRSRTPRTLFSKQLSLNSHSYPDAWSKNTRRALHFRSIPKPKPMTLAPPATYLVTLAADVTRTDGRIDCTARKRPPSQVLC